MNTLNVAMLLEQAARQAPGKTFIIADEQRFTFDQINTEAQRFANVLAGLDIKKGEKVALLLPNVPIFLTCYYGALKLGAVPVPLNVTAPGPEVAILLEDSGATVLVALASSAAAAVEGFEVVDGCRHLLLANLSDSEACPPPCLHLSELMSTASGDFETALTRPDEEAVILYTAGTTDRPKGVILTHFNYYFQAQYMAREFWCLDSDDVILMVAPAAHIFGQVMLNVACAAQATLSLMTRFDPQVFLRTIEKHKVTFFAGVPTLAHFMLQFPLVNEFDLSSLRRVMMGGAPMSPKIAAEFKTRFQVELITGYGLTEGVPVCYLSPGMYEAAPAGTVGLPALGISLRIVDEKGCDVPHGELGEIIVRGPQMFQRYHNRPQESQTALRDNWFHTGDVGRMDERGYVFIEDRLKDLIKRSGYSVSPSEIERVLYAHSAVAEAAVVGIPNKALGEEIKAFIALRPGASASAEELVEHCKARLAAYKYPRIIEFRDSLPKSPAGKVLRRALRE